MAEFCLDCWNKINNTEDGKIKYILSRELDLCEGCGMYKSVIIIERKAYYMRKFKYLILPIMAIYYLVNFILRLLILPYFIIKYRKLKRKDN